ncbi:nuclear transport factor 2 family protein [Luteimonas viscosa]|uniref:Nuclear transport factor 2 family protein n=1 Tax=Luteimonas viscosa TaxID=1132694 RepID=A0A5D4XN41_9GAMM|nr:nuclear transport factor 2 family protein [Luteimonas viscosa]TYT26097.1 nuclear transport factor 2 family protein [Luteimonas viscosa]
MFAKPLLGALLALVACHVQATQAPPPEGLAEAIAARDAAVFEAFNRCADPAQLEAHAGHFDPQVEFYHDTGGVTWTRDEMLANTRRHACGTYTRELVPGSLRVYPVHGFGAISQGTHRFCRANSGACEGVADFTMVWRHAGGAWRITRVLSYGHRAVAD